MSPKKKSRVDLSKIEVYLKLPIGYTSISLSSDLNRNRKNIFSKKTAAKSIDIKAKPEVKSYQKQESPEVRRSLGQEKHFRRKIRKNHPD